MNTTRRVSLFGLLLLLAPVAACRAEDPPASAPAPASDDAPAVSKDLPAVELEPAFPRLELRRPVWFGAANDGRDRLYVLEQPGRIRIFPNDSGVTDAGTFLDLRDVVFDRHNEEGLLALAFHPKYAENGRFFVYYSANEPRRGVISAFTRSADDPDVADRASEQVILEVEEPWGNHNGCALLFGPDGYLYASFGDGGWAGDPKNSGQDRSTLLGSIIRIDVDHADGERPYSIPKDNPFVGEDGVRGEIWAYGLRNVWRMSFDPETGDLWAGDVGQNAWEEIDLIVKGGNYGWNIREGRHPYRRDYDGDTSSLIDPVVEYPRSEGISVTGGVVYYGSAHPELRGVYLYADYAGGRMWGLKYADGAITHHREIRKPSPPRFITSFGTDAEGEVYVTTFDRIDGRGSPGRVWRIVPR